MAKLFEKMLDFVGWETNEEGEEEDFYEEEVSEPTPRQDRNSGAPKKAAPQQAQTQGKVLSMGSNLGYKVVVLSPQNILEAKELCDHLKSNRPVIMNVEGVDTPLAQRIVDFLSGAVYCLDGDIQKISSGIFLATPASIEITGDLKDEMRNKGVFSWVK